MIQTLQRELPKLWTDDQYSVEFRNRVSDYKDFDHALKHIVKATGRLMMLAEDADHVGSMKTLITGEVQRYVADLVICSVRLAITNPEGSFDLEKAIRDRIQEKMGVTLK